MSGPGDGGSLSAGKGPRGAARGGGPLHRQPTAAWPRRCLPGKYTDAGPGAPAAWAMGRRRGPRRVTRLADHGPPAPGMCLFGG